MTSRIDRVTQKQNRRHRFGQAERDFLALGIAAAAIIMFVGTGGAVMPAVIASLAGYGIGPDKVLLNALLLNIALIIFGWRRFRQLSQEVKERRRAEEQVRILAETDSLTGTLNRRSFGRALDKLILDTTETTDCVAIMMIDLDNFKQVNDSNGHSVGDRVLVECATRINSVLPAGSLLARIGGDEFACALPFSSNTSQKVDWIASTIADAICEPTRVGSASVEISASIGITRADVIARELPQGSAARHLLDLADVAMYHAKRQGRNSYFWFEDFMADEMRFRASMEAGIRQGLRNDEFVPYYEQQIDLQSGRITGFEMLARWDSPQFGLINPDIFIPVAEQMGVISELSERLIARALDDAREWAPALSLAVNISPIQLRDPWFSQKLLKLLVSANFPPDRLEIEITESCIHEDLVQVRSLIASLKNQGIRVSLDDFGTGYSSFSQVQMLPFDRIKIDRSFISSLAESKDSAAIVSSIAELGKGLGLPLTAEGIESDAILQQLREFKDLKGQGYLYGLPKSAADTNACLLELGLLLPQEKPSESGNTRPEPEPYQDSTLKIAGER